MRKLGVVREDAVTPKRIWPKMGQMCRLESSL